ncbi:MAG: hypothetical protein O7G85_07285 [Planctomycetota bacterium]|nr:hypothetical protein [Planctomycetota bacterium]
MTFLKKNMCLGITALGLIFLTGCIERKEHLTIREDGSVKIEVEHTSNSWDEMYMGDAWPRLEAGWLALDDSRREDDGTESFTLKAEAIFPPDLELPSHYEIDKDPFPGTSTRFPTQLLIERRRDGLYYHFKRTYLPREWAYIGKIREEIEARFQEDEEEFDSAREFAMQTLEPVIAQSEQQREMEMIKALTEFETIKLEHFTQRALHDAVPKAPQDVFLIARQTLREQAALIDFDRIAQLLAQPDDEMRERMLEDEVREYEQRTTNALEMALLGRGRLGGSEVRAFFTRLEWHREYYRITEELADDVFMITVAMPGEIVAHNADDLDGNEVTWELSGDQFRDREVTLMVTSRVR